MANQVVYGFENLADVFDRRASQVGVGVVNAAIDQAVGEHREQMNAALDVFVRPTTEGKTTYRQPIVTRNQPLDEHGRARPIKGGLSYDLAYPLEQSGNAWGFDYVAGQYMTVGEINDTVAGIISGDIRWMFDHLLAAMYDNTTWTYTDARLGTLTIQPLANGDTVTYHVFGGADTAATDDHFLAQAAAIADASNPYPTIFDELSEHPENGNGGEVIAFIPTGLRATTEALATFHPVADGNVQRGANSDVLTGSLGVRHPGRLIGYEDSGVWIVEWRRLTANYIVAVHTGGAEPVGMRESEIDALRGFVEIPGPGGVTRSDYPWYERQWLRMAGFGAYNRVAAVVYRIGNASYAIPTNFTNPIR